MFAENSGLLDSTFRQINNDSTLEQIYTDVINPESLLNNGTSRDIAHKKHGSLVVNDRSNGSLTEMKFYQPQP